jgi:CRISPR/Cas system-associated endonuclease/helicase Cas3
MEFHPLLDLLIPHSHTPSELVHRIHSNIHNRAFLNRYKDALIYWNKHELRTKAFCSLEQTSKEDIEELLYKYVRVFNKMFFSEGLPPHRYKLVLVLPTNHNKGTRTENTKSTTILHLPNPTKCLPLLGKLVHEMAIAFFQLYSKPRNVEPQQGVYDLGVTGHGLWWYAACVTIESFVWKQLGVNLKTSADFHFRSEVEGMISGNTLMS